MQWPLYGAHILQVLLGRLQQAFVCLCIPRWRDQSVSCVTIFSFGQSGEASRWVCYLRGLPRLVFTAGLFSISALDLKYMTLNAE